MGGKSYFCDYCCCFMKNDVNVRKTHNSGLAHVMAKCRYLRKYEDPKVILAEELAKINCPRFHQGGCKFDLYCKNSHYRKEQLSELKRIVQTMEEIKFIDGPNYDNLHWQSAQAGVGTPKKMRRKHKISLPPALRPIHYGKLREQLQKRHSPL